MPGKNAPGYQRDYHNAQSRTAAWVRHNLPAVFAYARGQPVDIDQVRRELRSLADDDYLELP